MKIDSDKLESLMKDAENHAKQGFSKAKEKVESIDRDELRQKVEEGLNTTKDAVKTGIEKVKEIDRDEVKEKVEEGLNSAKDAVKTGIEKVKEMDQDEIKQKVGDGLNNAKDAVKNKQVNNKLIMVGIAILICIFVGMSSLFGKSDLLSTPKAVGHYFGNYGWKHEKMSLEDRVKKFENTTITYDYVLGKAEFQPLTNGDGNFFIDVTDGEWYSVLYNFHVSKDEIIKCKDLLRQGKRVCISGKGKVYHPWMDGGKIRARIDINNATFVEVPRDRKLDKLEEKIGKGL